MPTMPVFLWWLFAAGSYAFPDFGMYLAKAAIVNANSP